MRWLVPLSRWLDERLRIALAEEIAARVRFHSGTITDGRTRVTVRSPLGVFEHEVEPGRELLVGSNGASINRPAPAADSGLYKPLRSAPGDVTPAMPDARLRKVALVEAAGRRHEWVRLAFDAPRSGHGVLLTEDQARVLREDLRTVLQASDLRRQIAALEKQLAERLAG